MLRRLTKVAETLGLNTLPLVGVFAGDWSWATALSVYWAENLIATVLIGLRLWLHGRWRPDPAVSGDTTATTPPGGFVGTSIAFTLAHGLFLVLIFVAVTRIAPDPGQLRQALWALLLMQGLAFGVDLWTLGTWPAARVNERAAHLLGRVVLVHLSIIAGMCMMAVFDQEWAFFACFAGLKALSDAAQFLPRTAVDPARPPRWLAAVANRFPARRGETFEQYWARTRSGGSVPPQARTGRRGRLPD